MAAVKPLSRLILHVILDLDDTLLNTGLCCILICTCCGNYYLSPGRSNESISCEIWKAMGSPNCSKKVGKTPLEAANAIVEDYSLPCSTEEFMTVVTPLFTEGLIRHLSSSLVTLVPLALASNSPRSNIESKISYHHDWKGSFSVIVGGNEVKNGDAVAFLEAAKRMNVHPSNYLLVEDSRPSGEAGKAAGMKVVTVPSIPKQTMQYISTDKVINSLLDLQPEKWGLPPFNDCTALKSLDTH
ncbi:hypothetical protein Taro_017904 [Colocasia esculenta]|uniref:Uncharacterized protein n=1 Tax=Colocasia esculenta TaxID=4460 RepID=A0A843UPD4_COLES|nr:hypothetical protein [Colocasia esculenta]